MKERPIISVVLPAYNAEKTLSEAIESILDQSVRDFELIIVDDGSTDRTSTVIDQFNKLDSRIVLIRNERNLGEAMSRNIGLQVARGLYVATMDSDDYSQPDRLATQFAFMESHSEVVLCGSFVELCNSGLHSIKTIDYPIDDAAIRKMIFRISPFSHPSTFFRAEIARIIGGYPISFRAAVDYDFYFRMGLHGKLANIERVLLRYRVHNASLSQIPETSQAQQETTLFVRLKAVFEYGYPWSFGDKVYWVLQFVGLKILPTSWIFRIYHLVRKIR
jgi:glycosyltransferase involved in cell wall biosynthesis